MPLPPDILDEMVSNTSRRAAFWMLIAQLAGTGAMVTFLFWWRGRRAR